MISECVSDDIPPQMKILNMVISILNGYLLSIAQLTYFLQKDSENVVCCVYSQWLPVAQNHFSANEKQCYLMTLSLPQYITGHTL